MVHIPIRRVLQDFRWYHYVGGVIGVAGVNVGILGGFVRGYQWYYSDFATKQARFASTYGRPTEEERLDIFRWFAPLSGKEDEKAGASQARNIILQRARGDVLEVAVGSGRSFDQLKGIDTVRSYVGVDCLEEMLEVARTRTEGLPFAATLVRADACHLPFPDQSFDTVIGTLCLCSLEDPVAGLDEMARVCRKDGHVLLVEPGLSRYSWIREAQSLLYLVPDPKHAWTVGWREDLEPLELVRASRLKIESWNTRRFGNWYYIDATPE